MQYTIVTRLNLQPAFTGLRIYRGTRAALLTVAVVLDPLELPVERLKDGQPCKVGLLVEVGVILYAVAVVLHVGRIGNNSHQVCPNYTVAENLHYQAGGGVELIIHRASWQFSRKVVCGRRKSSLRQ